MRTRHWKSMAVGLLTLLATACCCGPDTPARAAEAARGDLARLQGTWTARTGRGKDIKVVLKVEADAVDVAIATPGGLQFSLKGNLKVDDAATPKALDWTGLTFFDGQEFPDNLAIYALEGDTFTLRNGGPNNARPREFAPGEGALAGVVVFSREQPLARTARAK